MSSGNYSNSGNHAVANSPTTLKSNLYPSAQIPSPQTTACNLLARVDKVGSSKCPPPAKTLISSSSGPSIFSVGEKLPLNIVSGDGKTYKIEAYTYWTLKQLKTEFLLRHSQQEFGSLTLQGRAGLLTGDDSCLSSYKLESANTLQANFGKDRTIAGYCVPKMNTDSDFGKPSNEKIQLIGNCVALKNGTEAFHVEGINWGNWVMARIDFENLSMGEVGMACNINGYGKTVYVGVKFRKQLALGSSGIQIQHIGVNQGYCDKCKGRKLLFIPLEQIGRSKDHLFQVE